ncbi:MAG: sterol desaturase family protein [Rubrivivax sp.]|jgi:sterol desaturase/sphingolipid hydroxylase (fatty acid hydroxylase superfamily)
MNTDTLVWLTVILGMRVALVAALQQLCTSSFARKRRIYDLPIGLKQAKRERYAHAGGAALDALALGAMISTGLIDFVEPSLAEPAIFLAVHVLLVEPLYYAYHRALHTRYLFRKHHFLHHLSTVTQPSTSFTFTLAERVSYTALFALPILAASHLGALSLTGLAVYLLVFDLVNSIGHFNFEFFPEGHTRNPLARFFYTPTFHARHHSKFNCNFSLFVPVFDHLFKTADPEEHVVFERARSGRPLKSLGQQGETDPP